MKKMKLPALCIAMLLLLANCMAGCAINTEIPDDDDHPNEKVDKTRTQLYVGIYNGGVGSEWFHELKRMYEAKHPEVQLMLITGKLEYESSTLRETINGRMEDIYFIDSFSYYNYVNNSDVLMDITDIVEKEVDGRSIESVMNDSLKKYFKTPSGRYYAMPYYQGEHSLSYDVDLFDEESLFIKSIDASGNITEWGKYSERHVGRDGIAGTYDDGLPITYSQFFALLDRIKGKEMIPFTWSGDVWDEYFTLFARSVTASYSGAEVYSYNYNDALDSGVELEVIDGFTKEHEYGKFSSEEFTTKTVRVDWNNFEEMQNVPGNYLLACFAHDLISDEKNYDSLCVGAGDSHLDAQERFLYSKFRGGKERIAMFFDGSWWENEARAVFKDMAYDYGDEWSRSERRFGMMPLPMADDASGAGAQRKTYSPFSGSSATFIRKNAKQPELAKDFYEFCHTEAALVAFSGITGIMRPYDYDLTEMENTSYYSKHVYESYQNADIVYRNPVSEITRLNEDYIFYKMFWQSTNNGGYLAPFHTFFKTGLSAQYYFNGLKSGQMGSKSTFKLED